MKIQNEKIFKLVSAIGDLQEDMVYQSVCELAEQNMTPYYIQKCINIGMELIDGYYQSGEYFLADLLYAGYIYINILQMKQMQVLKKPGVKIAKVLIGTPSGDIHDIGKDIVACTLKSNGYDVIDLGIDVSADSFVNAVMTHQPDIVAVGCMNPESFEELKNIIKIIIEKDPIRADIKILICGNKKLAHSYKDYGEDAVVIWIQIVRHKNNMPVAYEDKYLPYQKGFPIIESLLHHVE